jgi:hypothetical protein
LGHTDKVLASIALSIKLSKVWFGIALATALVSQHSQGIGNYWTIIPTWTTISEAKTDNAQYGSEVNRHA